MINVAPDVTIDELDQFLLEFQQHDQEIFAGVMVVGDPAAYALVWEWGNVRQVKPGPKTVMGTNPDGDMVWLSSQAPFGWIRRNEDEYWDALEHELSKAKFVQPNARAMTLELEKAAKRASKLIRDIMKEAVPKDSGDLADALEVVDPEDPILERETDAFETFVPVR